MKIDRMFTTAGQDAYAGVPFVRLSVEICGPDGFPLREVEIEVPASWSQSAADALVQHALCPAGVPARLCPLPEPGVPEFLWRSVADRDALCALPEPQRHMAETSARQVFDRMAGAWAYWGWKGGCFASVADARAWYNEMRHMLARQIAAPEAAQWRSTGLHWAYGIGEPATGEACIDPATGLPAPVARDQGRVRLHGSFLRGAGDDLAGPGGLLDLWRQEAGLLAAGPVTGPVTTGSNFSALRGAGEPGAAGGRSAGLIETLRIGDQVAAAAGAVGPAGRAARMVICDVDHPEIAEFVTWKLREDQKAASLVAGSRMQAERLNAVRAAVTGWQGPSAAAGDPVHNGALHKALGAARAAGLPETVVQRALDCARQGHAAPDLPVHDTDWDREAHATVAARNATHAVRVSDAFLDAVRHDRPWALIRRSDGQVARHLRARDLWDWIGEGAWACVGPGLQFHDTINAWHTCPEAGPIRCSSPGAEYLFLDETACTQATLNLLAFAGQGAAAPGFEAERFAHAVRLWTLGLEISVQMARFPDPDLARRTQDYRPLGLGYANLGPLLMTLGLGYDSAEGRALCAAVTALMTGTAYATSAEMAADLGPFAGHARNRDHMLRVIRNHHRAALGAVTGHEGLAVAPVPLDPEVCPDPALAARAEAAWDAALRLGVAHGYRNAQVTLLAPAGPAGLLMGGATPGIAPERALVSDQALAGGEYIRVIAPSVPAALERLGYAPRQIAAIVAHAIGHGTLATAPGVNHAALIAHGFGPDEIDRVEDALAEATDLRQVFTPWTLGVAFCTGVLGIPPARLSDPAFDLLGHLGFDRAQIAAACAHACGAMTLEGAPHLRPEHAAVFDCARTCGPGGQRRVSAAAQLRMMAAAQGFVSGGIAATILLPQTATIAEAQAAHDLAWSLGLKSSVLAREAAGQSLPQPEGPGAGAEAAAPPDRIPQPAAPIAGPVGRRAPLPGRLGHTQRAIVGGQEVCLRTGEHADGSLGEIRVEMPGAEAGHQALMNSFATAVSLGLQHGVPLAAFVEAFAAARLAPAGPVQGHDAIRTASSVIDYIFRDLALSYPDQTDLPHAYARPPAPQPPGQRAFELLRQIGATGALHQPLPRDLMALGGPAHLSPDGAADRQGQARPPVPWGAACTRCGGLALWRGATGLTCTTCGRNLRPR